MKHFKADLKITKGLSLAITKANTKLNLKHFEITVQRGTYEIFKRGTLTILTTKDSKSRVFQFCLKKNFNPIELKQKECDSISLYIKELILETHRRSKMLSIEEIMNLC
ncbi:MAG: hypothetical protein ACKVIG_06905 [Flavobacteriales bacterium]